MRKVYCGGRGSLTLFVCPGVDEPDNERWFPPPSVDEHGERRKGRPWQFAVSFDGGVAKVESELARYLLDKRLASRKPQPLEPKGGEAPSKITLCKRIKAAVVGFFR